MLSLGRFLIWLAAFLFFYSSAFVLIENGLTNYPANLASIWSTVGDDLVTSYQDFSSQEESSEEGGGKKEKSGEIPGFASLLIWCGLIVAIMGRGWLVFVAFQDSVLWGVAVLLLPFGDLLYLVTHFREAIYPFIMQFFGGFMVGFISAFFGIDLGVFFLGETVQSAKPAAALLLHALASLA